MSSRDIAGKSKITKSRKPVVLVVGPLFPQGGGVGMVDSTLLACGLDDDFDMRHLNIDRGRAGAGKEGQMALVNLYYFAGQTLKLVRELIFHRPAILHQSITDSIAFWKESFFMLLARCMGVQVVAHVHGNRLEPQYQAAGPLVRHLMRSALSLPSAIVVLNEHYHNFLAEVVASSTRFAVVPNAVDPNVAAAMECSRREQRESATVLFIGFIGSRKGVPDALRAIPLVHNELPGVHFVFAGPLDAGADRLMVEMACEAAQAEGLANFPGLVAGPEKVALMEQADIFILPSYRENLPVAILDAMAMGLPVVTTTVAGIPEIVEDGRNGFLIQPGDYEALARRIVILAQDASLRHAMGQANVAKVRQEYHPRVFAARIRNLYNQLLTLGRSDGAAVSSPLEP